MRIAGAVALSLALWISAVAPAAAQPYPVSGNVYLSFSPTSRVSSQAVTPLIPFELYITVDIPADPTNPSHGVAGVEGGIAFPPSVELMSIAYAPPALDIGWNFSEPELESFIVGLGQCIPLGSPFVVGTVTARLLLDESDVEIAVDAPSVGAAAVSSFAGIGPGWAQFDCDGAGDPELVLFEPPTTSTSNVIVNPSVVQSRGSSFAQLKALY